MLSPGEITKTMFVTVHSWKEGVVDNVYADTPYGRVLITTRERTNFMGAPMQVLGVSRPYIVCKPIAQEGRIVLDLRDVNLMEVQRDYVEGCMKPQEHVTGIFQDDDAPSTRSIAEILMDHYSEMPKIRNAAIARAEAYQKSLKKKKK